MGVEPKNRGGLKKTPQNGWFIYFMVNQAYFSMDDLGVPLMLETPI